jgi:hypothetical protein
MLGDCIAGSAEVLGAEVMGDSIGGSVGVLGVWTAGSACLLPVQDKVNV